MILRTPRARRDLIHHFAYLWEHSPDAAGRFLQAASAAFQKLEKMPELGHRWHSALDRLQGVRVWPLIPRFRKYLIFYRPVKGGIEILHVFHSAQDIATILEEEEP